ncbi:sporulation control protein Spo0M [Vibrio sp. 10N.286.49.C2]|uniref:sporulation protein n=1 Tax=unclassified Vibrio TaxID=2614977 RepID=UPI000C851BAE|nr:MULTISPECIES: sporulation protein [unclassified Vibrio]PMH36518.1 sporulation control protein Spo0M [Vibrio sp. 10N.286.49.C2]PMH52423.1 sporulation control protein Spo0M [Vibrio sp. 10N.286.49.B1]PMH83553.1 sporulation control protein Spo0M [Vibrio sp. 10N.286.48.B7]
MSFFKKTLASFGIGAARVDSVLHQEFLYPGQAAKVTVHVYGGKTAQTVDNINMRLCCRYIDEVARGNHDNQNQPGSPKKRVAKTYAMETWKLPYAFTIEPGETRDFEVELLVPWNTPVTLGDSKVWLETGLDIALAADPTDKDLLTVRPDPLLDGIFSALEHEGLRIRQVECEAAKGFAMPFVQEFEFVPTTGPYHGRWRELEIVAYRDEDVLKLWFEIDRNRDGIGGMLSSLIGAGQLKRELSLPSSMSAEEAGKKVLDYLDQTS